MLQLFHGERDKLGLRQGVEGSLLQLLLKLRRDIDKDLLDVFALELEGLFKFEA